MTPGAKQQRAIGAFSEALACHRAGDLVAALARYDAAVKLDPGFANAFNNRGIALAQLGRANDALKSYGRAASLDPCHVDAVVNQGMLLGELGRFDEALARLDRALALDPNHAQAEEGRARTIAALKQAPDGTPGDLDGWLALGLARAASGAFAAALEAFDCALALDGGHAVALGNRGACLLDLGRHDAALDALERSIARNPAVGGVHRSRGDALHALHRHDDAVASYDAAIALGEDDAAMHARRADALATCGRFEAALAGYRAALARQPDVATLLKCGHTLWQCNDPAAALDMAEAAIARDAGLSGALNLRGLALQALGRREAALASFDQALALEPGLASAHNNRGELLLALGDIDGAVASLERAIAHDPALRYVAGQLLHLRMRLAHWDGLIEQVAELRDGVIAGDGQVLPFALLALVDDPALHRIAAADHLARRYPEPAAPLPAWPRADRIRIGYFSANFYAHAILYLIAEVLEAHDRDRFEIVGFSHGPDTGDGWRMRAARACERFIDVRRLGDRDIAALARDLRIDIAVDLTGLTGGGRPGIFAARAAPLQINYLGYPGTIPVPFFDYVIADRMVIPPEACGDFGEAVIRLPHSYQPNCRIANAGGAVDRRDEGLPEGFVFCSFNQAYKITPDYFAAWMRILRETGDSVLWLWVDDATARANLRREAAKREIAPERLRFAEMRPRDAHLARLSLADLFLDTGPYGAHTTASDALRTGLPVLTCPGRSFASRVAASLLGAAGLPELICSDLDDYAARAIGLAHPESELAALRARLTGERAAAPLFDPARFARHLERAYRAAHARQLAGLPVEAIEIGEDGKVHEIEAMGFRAPLDAPSGR